MTKEQLTEEEFILDFMIHEITSEVGRLKREDPERLARIKELIMSNADKEVRSNRDINISHMGKLMWARDKALMDIAHRRDLGPMEMASLAAQKTMENVFALIDGDDRSTGYRLVPKDGTELTKDNLQSLFNELSG